MTQVSPCNEPCLTPAYAVQDFFYSLVSYLEECWRKIKAAFSLVNCEGAAEEIERLIRELSAVKEGKNTLEEENKELRNRLQVSLLGGALLSHPTLVVTASDGVVGRMDRQPRRTVGRDHLPTR